MASAGQIRAGQAYVEIFANDSKFQQSMTRIRTTMQSVGTQLRRAGTGMFLGGAAIGAPLLIAARTAADFSIQMARVRANTGATDSQFASLTASAKELAVAFGRAPEEAAGAMSELAKAGLDAQGVMRSISPILALAAADNMELARAVEVAVSTMAQFGMTTNDFGQIADKLQAAANVSTTSVDLLGEALSYVGPKAKEAGQSFGDVAAALATLADAGLRGSLGGTGLARVIESIANEEGKLKALGVRTRNAADNSMRPFMDILEELGQQTANMPNSDRIRAFTDIFEIRGANAAMSLTKMRDEFEKALSTITNSAGAAEGKAGTVLESFGGQVAKLSAQFGVLKIQIVESLGPGAATTVASVTSMVKAFGNFAAKNGELVAALGKFAVALTAAGVAAMLLGTILQTLSVTVGLTNKAFLLLAANPAVATGLAAAVVAIGGIGLALRQLWPDFRQTTDEWLRMLDVMSEPPEKEKLVEPRDLMPKLREKAQGELQDVIRRQQSGENVNVAAEMRRIAADEADVLDWMRKLQAGRSGTDVDAMVAINRGAGLRDLIAKLDAQMESERSKAASAAAPQKRNVEAAPVGPTDAQMQEADRIRLANRTPKEELADERKKLLDLLDSGALSEADFIKAIGAAEADAMEKIARANKDAEREFDRIADRIADIRGEVATPEEKLAARIEELKKLPLDPETFARAVEKAKADAVDAMTRAAQEEKGKGFSTAGTFGEVSGLGIGPELVDPMREVAENTREMVNQLAAIELAKPMAEQAAAAAAAEAPAQGVGAQVAAPRAAAVRQAAAAGEEAATQTVTLTNAVNTMSAQIAAAIGKTTQAVEATMGVLQKIADNTTDLGGAFL